MRFNPRLVLAMAGFLIAHFLLPYAIRWGSAWESQAHPTPAEVELNGKAYNGLLSHDGNGTLHLTDGSGHTLLSFQASDPATVNYHPHPDAMSPLPDWRRYLPFVLVAGVALLCCVPTLLWFARRLFTRRRPPPAS